MSSYTKNNQWLDPNAYKQIRWGHIRRFVHYYKPVRQYVVAALGLSLLFSGAAFLIPVIFTEVQTALQVRSVTALTLALVAYLGLTLFQNASNYGITKLQVRIYTLMNKAVLLRYYEKLLNAAVPDFLHFKNNSNLFQRVMDAMSITSQFTSVVIHGIRSVVVVVVYGVVIGLISWSILLVLAAGAVALASWVTYQASMLQDKRQAMLSINYPLVGKMLEVINGLLTIKALSASMRTTSDITGLVDRKKDAEYDEAVASARVHFFSQLIETLTLLGAVALSFGLLLAGSLTLAEVFAVYVLVGGFLGPVSELAGYYQGLTMLSVNLMNYFEVLDLDDESPVPAEAPEDAEDAARPARLAPAARLALAGGDGFPDSLAATMTALPAPTGRIALRDVTFSYDGSRNVIEGLNVEIEPGEKIALIGRSGAGKTTFLRLLLDFLKPQHGAVLIDDVDVRAIADKNAYRSRFGIVNQDDFLFNISLRENLLFGLQQPRTDEDLIGVLEAVNLWEDVDRLDDDLDTIYHDNLLSGGQKQRLLIARALIRDPDIVLLDEPTSALDFENEQEILHALDVLMHDKTTVTIAHRLTTVRGADRVLVLDDGKIVAEGRHDVLYDTNAYYRALCDFNSFLVG